ncbi:hypothetical protein [Methanolobus sp. WCC5]|jgi:hypothetical protein|uniref:hypothetical protein n=1 Tax=Methanolobus sp. WCC5 TaxID=3125785 RepID=UPI00324F5331
MDLSTFWNILSDITVDSIHQTKHFRERTRSRFGDEFTKEVYNFIFDHTPVAIVQQDEQKFKVLYSYSNDYDLTVVFGIKEGNPLKLSLVTCHKVESKRRLRIDE